MSSINITIYHFVSICVLAVALALFSTARAAEPIFSSPPPLLQTLPPAQVDSILDLFSDSWRHGLNPSRYQTESLHTAVHGQPPNLTAPVAKLFDDNLSRYIGDITGMRIVAKEMDLRARDWRQPLKTDAALANLRAAPDPVAYLKSLSPQSALYQRLQSELADLRPILEQGRGHTAIYPIQKLKRSLKPGDVNPVVTTLRDRLGAPANKGSTPEKYDDQLAQTVMEFQRHHGLKEDGIIGPQTMRFFNQTYFEKYRQIIANLERLRWLPPEKPSKYIVVNIPAATLWAVRDGAVITEMPVIVGRAKRPTPQFQTMITGVRFNPTWTVPETILAEDFVPELIKNPDFLSTKGVEVWQLIEGGEKVQINPHDIDWAAITPEVLKTYRFIQPAGAKNVLGQIRIIMPNQYDVYLHDTNTPEYFREENRDISSGCIRLSRPQEIARFVLSDTPNWDDGKMAKFLTEADVTREVRAEPPFPVILLYQTAWLKNDGALVLAYDIYEDDIRLYNLLTSHDLIPKFSK